MNATSGPTSPRRFARYDPDSCSWRTWPAISLWDSMSSAPTWPKWGTAYGGDAYELPTPAHLTGANASSSLPTPTSRDHKGRNQRNDATCLPGAVALLPTPAAKEPGGTIEQYRARFKDGRASTFVPLGMIGELLPTPCASDSPRTRKQAQDRLMKDHQLCIAMAMAVALLGAPTDPLSDDGNTSPDQRPRQLTIEDV